MWRVTFTNEGGERCSFDVAATLSRHDAIIEAWALYRELPFRDGEFPPDWTKPHKLEAIP